MSISSRSASIRAYQGCDASSAGVAAGVPTCCAAARDEPDGEEWVPGKCGHDLAALDNRPADLDRHQDGPCDLALTANELAAVAQNRDVGHGRRQHGCRKHEARPPRRRRAASELDRNQDDESPPTYR
jgi:hypothetical protein